MARSEPARIRSNAHKKEAQPCRLSGNTAVFLVSIVPAWEQRKLSSTCEQLLRTINPLETPNEEFTEYSMPGFENNETAETVIGNSMNSLRKIVDRPCLLVNKLNVRKKRIWHVPRPEANAVCSSEFVPFSSHSSDLSFIKISVLSERITAYLESCSSGSSNSQRRVTPRLLCHLS